MACGQEMCEYWAGDAGCPCAVLDLEPTKRCNHGVLSDEWCDRCDYELSEDE